MTKDQYREAAKKRHASDDLEIDENARVVFPDEGDEGAWVQAWLWIRDEDASEAERPF